MMKSLFRPRQAPDASILDEHRKLIRSLEDRGLLALLDNRILKKQYGKVFLASLPAYRRTTELAEVEAFFGIA